VAHRTNVDADGPILALDLASATGWAEGRPGEVPTSGYFRFAPAGASQEAIGWRAIEWARRRFDPNHPEGKRYRLILVEEPLPSTFARGKTNKQTGNLLIGLAFQFGSMAYGFGQFNYRVAAPRDVRQFFIGNGRLKGLLAKAKVAIKCRELGWVHPTRPVPHDQTDALALWAYGCECLQPGSMLSMAPLFGGDPDGDEL
jgi:hypothetical protein